ncbi:rhomboid family intramembrane serine protease [Sandaracinus amylolyticus]|uniref:rhomboid family intramembrane serine protease n=1 Tax=Sandaracinus amylolyticus TaxID=927083 RepID=UPI001F29CBD8|nr:rhomboid family intramembrane serine protease [Sandaracinus amylolyticus]
MAAAPTKRVREPTFADLGRELKLHGLVLAILVAVLWAEEIVDVFLGGYLDAFGIRPREIAGLIGIPLSPFLHAGFPHLIANTVPLIVLGWFVMLRETWHFFAVSAAVIVLGGLGVWMFGQTGSVHIGASGLVFGWLGYLLLGGWFERRVSTILGSLLVAVLYGGLVWGVLPGTPGVSWEAHLFGFLAGALMAWVLARREKAARA